MGNVRLTVAIPTFNGFRTLSQTLESVIKEISSLNRFDVNLEIFDNGSTGQSADFLNALALPEGSIVHRNTVNAGYDENIKRAVQCSQGDFVKILADDDVLVPGSLASLLAIIETHDDISFIVSDFSKFSTDMATEIEAPILSKQLSNLQKGESGLELARGRFGQVSSLAFRRAYFTNAVTIPGMGTNYLHVSVVYALALRHSYFIQTGTNVQVRDGSPNFTGSVERSVSTPVDGLGAIRNLRSLGYSRKFTRATYKTQAKYLFGIFMFGKRQGVNRLPVMIAKSISILGPRPELLIAFLACLIPSPIFDPITNLIKPSSV